MRLSSNPPGSAIAKGWYLLPYFQVTRSPTRLLPAMPWHGFALPEACAVRSRPR